MWSSRSDKADRASSSTGWALFCPSLCDSSTWDLGTQRGYGVQGFENEGQGRGGRLRDGYSEAWIGPWVKLLQLLAHSYKEYLGKSRNFRSFLKLVAIFYLSTYPYLLPASLFLYFQTMYLSVFFPASVTADCTDIWLYSLGLSLLLAACFLAKSLSLWNLCPYSVLPHLVLKCPQ